MYLFLTPASFRNSSLGDTSRIRGSFPQLWGQFLEADSSNVEDEAVAGRRSQGPGLVLEDPRPGSLQVTVEEPVLAVRPFIATCIVRGVDLAGRNCKKLINAQNKFHAGACKKRSLATLGTHDLAKVGEGRLTYTARSPADISIVPIGAGTEKTGVEVQKMGGELAK